MEAGLKVTLFEFYYFLGNDPAIKIDFHAGEDSSVDYVRFKHGDLDGEIRFITNTNIGENTYINNRNLSVLSSVCSLVDNVFLQSENAKIEMLNVKMCIRDRHTSLNRGRAKPPRHFPRDATSL